MENPDDVLEVKVMEIDNRKFLLALARAEMSNDVLAKEAGVSPSTIQRFKRADGKATTQTIGRLAKALHVDVADIVK